MEPEKTIVCKITQPNKGKLQKIKEEYSNAQKYIHGKEVDLYSATKQAMDKYIEKVKGDREYPLHLRSDTFFVEKAGNTEKFDYWARIPVANTYGKVTVPIIPHEKIKEEYDIKDSKIVRKDYGFELHLSISKELKPVEEYNGVIGIDMGLNKLAVSVSLPDRQTHCYGTHVGNIQAKYYFLRRNCSNGYVRRKWDNKEKNKIEDFCHQISRKIVNTAKEKNILLILGNLEGIQEEDNGRKMNRKLHNFPHWKLRNYIKYKAEWEGIEVIEISEAYTSQICSSCGEIGDRHKGKFKCSNCGLEVDSDKNGAHNIAVRGIGKFFETSSDTRSHMTWLETTTDEGILEVKLSNTWNVHSKTSVYQVPEVGGNLSKRSEAPSFTEERMS